MSKNRHPSWWSEQTGGMPHWAVIASAVLVVAIGGWALSQQPESVSADPNRAPRPVPTFTQPPSSESAQPVFAAFLGDSYTLGTRASDPAVDSWTAQVSKESGWSSGLYAVGGSGFINPGPNGDAPYSSRIDDIIEAKPDIVVVSGGRNDQYATYAETHDAATEVFSRLHDGLPSATLYVINPWWDDDEPTDGFKTASQAILDAAAETGTSVIDTGQPLYQHPEYLSADGIHPNDDGYAALAQAVLSALPID